ncbi:MAG: methyltransferase domain-containing protein [Phycisphaerales bacterium]|nr:methyltransferase domain-containing protein [Phycisphaerales bacterium]
MGLMVRVKALMARALRPGLAGVVERVARLEELAASRHTSEVGRWRGGLADGRATRPINGVDIEAPDLAAKYRDELAFWVSVVRNPEKHEGIGDFERTFGAWQRDRIVELGRFVGAPDEDDVRAWCARQSVVEIGPGPYPAIAAARWRRAIAVDPLADGYVREDLLPKNAHCDEVVFVAAPGEAVPVPGGAADLVIAENCLDHVSDPARVVLECRRVLRPGGLLWLLVDLMDYSDHMHPHSFNEEKLRRLIATTGFEVVRDRVSKDHKSHPNAYGEYRALLARPGGTRDIVGPAVTTRIAEPVRAGE